jgi:hypothetical protein
MPRFKGDPPGPTSVVHIRVRDDIMARIKEIQPKGGHADQSEAAFLGYLIGVGTNVYEKQILPSEMGESVYETRGLRTIGLGEENPRESIGNG